MQPDDPETNYSLGMLYAQQDQMQRASEYLQRAIGLRPDYPEALNNLGVLFVRGQDYTKAEEQFKAGIRVAPNFDQSYLNLARLYMMQNNKEKAKGILLELLSMQPGNASAKQALEMLQ
jgi:Flp pilus assembly protein TadD